MEWLGVTFWIKSCRLQNKEYENSKGVKNKGLFKIVVDENKQSGIWAYENQRPIGWCSISLRQSLKRIETSRLFKPIDKILVWSITCLSEL